MRYLVIIIVAVFVVSCKKYDIHGNEIKTYEELEKSKWLLGEWQKSDSLGILTEKWELLDDSTFVGHSYFIINEKDTVHNETMQLMQVDKHLIYSTTTKGENNDNEVQYQLTEEHDSLLNFENPKKDFPKRIAYFKKKNNILVIQQLGSTSSKKVQKNYYLNKVK